MKRFLFSSLLLLALGATLMAKGGSSDPYKGYEESVFMDMDLEQNLLTPEVGKEGHAAVKKYMNRLGTTLNKKGYTVDMMRDDEVVAVIIPTDELFLPNDTLLSPQGPAKLTPIVTLLNDPEMFKVVYTVHTDNTGSAMYKQWLARERNNSVYDWMIDQVDEAQIVIPYEMADSDPLEPNTSRKGRAANRRVEIYLIPGPKMITQARKGLLK